MVADAGTVYPYPRSSEPVALFQTLRTLIDALNRQARGTGEEAASLQAALDSVSNQITALENGLANLTATVGGISTSGMGPQQAFELALSSAKSDVFGSTQAAVDEALRWGQDLAEAAMTNIMQTYRTSAAIAVEQTVRIEENIALAQQITALNASLATTGAAVTAEQTARADGDSALAQSVATVQSQANGNAIAITAVQQAIDGVKAQWGVAINANGQVLGLVRLDGGASGSTFTVLADKFVVAQPDGMGATQVFVVDNINGAPGVGINGGLLVDGSIAARSLSVSSLSAIAADLGTVTAGLLRNPSNTVQFNLSTGWIGKVDGSSYWDIANGVFQITV